MEGLDGSGDPGNKGSGSIFLTEPWLKFGMFMSSRVVFIGVLALVFGGWIYQSAFSGEAHNNHGVSLYKQGHYDEAIAELDQAIKMNPNDATAYSNRGL